MALPLKQDNIDMKYDDIKQDKRVNVKSGVYIHNSNDERSQMKIINNGPYNPMHNSDKITKGITWNQTLGPLGVGDSELRYNIVTENPNYIFNILKNEIKWETMNHKGNPVPRLVAIQGIKYIGNDNVYDVFEPVYRHPADDAPQLIQFTKYVDYIRKLCEQHVGHVLNHALIQYYRNGRDCIGEHSDKTIDIDTKSKIVNYSVGCSRQFILRNKWETNKDINMKNHMKNQKIYLPNNSLFIMGMQTNKYMLHSIRKDRRSNQYKRNDELLFGGQRISITFRKINTYMCYNKSKQLIVGQGTTQLYKNAIFFISHTEQQIYYYLANNINKFNAIPKEKKHDLFIKLIIAFSKENNEAKSFVWDKVYGNGFDVIL